MAADKQASTVTKIETLTTEKQPGLILINLMDSTCVLAMVSSAAEPWHSSMAGARSPLSALQISLPPTSVYVANL